MKTCFCKFAEKIKENGNLPLYLICMIVFLIGIIIGFLLAPVKKGISIGSYNQIDAYPQQFDDYDE